MNDRQLEYGNFQLYLADDNKDRYAKKISTDEMRDFVDSKKNINTVKKTKSDVNTFNEWFAKTRPECDKVLENLTDLELDNYLGSFFIEIRKRDGSEYEPDTLTSFQRSIDRHLQSHGRATSITDKQKFNSNKVLQAKRKELKESGYGNKTKKAEPLTEEEEEILWEKGVIGMQNPVALFNLVWLNNTKLLGFRGCHENRQLKYGDLELKTTIVDGKLTEFIEFKERVTKTRIDGTTTRAFQPKQFSLPANPQRCPVVAFKLYREQRPKPMDDPSSPFYIRPNYKFKDPSVSPWFANQAVGVHTLSSMMSKMCEQAEIPGRKTNHSVRKSACSRLLKSGIPPTTVIQLSGHKNVQSLNNYNTADIAEQQKMSNVLSSTGTPSRKRPAATVSHTVSRPQTENPNMAMVARPAEVHTAQPQMGARQAEIMRSLDTQPQGIFAGATIYGGTFHVNVTNPSQIHEFKRARIE